MDRRTKARLDLQLRCRIGDNKLLSAPLEVFTENMSRGGMLMRWMEPFPLPAVGCSLTVDVPLPANHGSEPRLMRCGATVVRIVRRKTAQPSVGLRIDHVRFVEPKAASGQYPLQTMPAANDRIV
jgi:c-di-GMP-binding flagellar brake protein YcgR